MQVFLALPLIANSTALNRAVETNVAAPNRWKLQADRGWLIQFEGTTVELSSHLGLTGQAPGVPSPVGSAIVAPITGYYGRGPADMWEWLKTRFEL